MEARKASYSISGSLLTVIFNKLSTLDEEKDGLLYGTVEEQTSV